MFVVLEGYQEASVTYHPLIAPVIYSRFGCAKSSCLGVSGNSAPSLDTLMMRTRLVDLLEAAVDSRIGSSVLVSKKWARWFVCHWVSKPLVVSLKGTAMICSKRPCQQALKSTVTWGVGLRRVEVLLRQHC